MSDLSNARYRWVTLHQASGPVFVRAERHPAPLPPLGLPEPTEPAHRGRHFAKPSPHRSAGAWPGARRRGPLPLYLRFASTPAASLAVAAALVAACIALVFAVPMGPAL